MPGSQPLVTYAILVVTAVTSISAFNNQATANRMIFHPYTIKRQGDWLRFFTSGLIHANWMHLILNMYVFYIFGRQVEAYFVAEYGNLGGLWYLLMYVAALPLSGLYSYFKHKDDSHYAALGASGAVSAVVFASILLMPMQMILLFFILPMPAFALGILYLAYSWYMGKRGGDNIGHDAHFYGAVIGFLFPGLLRPQLFIKFGNEIVRFFQSFGL